MQPACNPRPSGSVPRPRKPSAPRAARGPSRAPEHSGSANRGREGVVPREVQNSAARGRRQIETILLSGSPSAVTVVSTVSMKRGTSQPTQIVTSRWSCVQRSQPLRRGSWGRTRAIQDRARACFWRARDPCYRLPDVLVYAVVDDALSPEFPPRRRARGFVRREDAERFIGEVQGDDPDVAAYLRIEER